MTYYNDLALAVPPPPIGMAGRGYRSDVSKGHNKRQVKPRGKSQPFDPEDLRRRLYMVIAEQEAQEARRQRQRGRVDSLRAKKAQLEKEDELEEIDNVRLQRMGPTSTKTAPSQGRLVPIPKSRSRSRSNTRSKNSVPDKPRSKPTTIVVSEVDASIEAAKATRAGHPYVPAQAATQFRRTTTSEGMREKSLVHSLSKAALRFYAEGTTTADREAIHASLTPGKQQNILRRARGQRDCQHVRTQFQGSQSNMGGGEGGGGPRRRPNRAGGQAGGVHEIAIIEEEELSALADLHLHSLAAGQGQGIGEKDDDSELFSSEDTLIDQAAAMERRIDWTQSDEVMPHERRGGGMTKLTPLLLRKTSSIFKLGGKLGGHMRRNSADDKDSSETGNNTSKLRIVTTNIPEHHVVVHHDEEAEAEADDGSTPMSPNSGSSRSGKLKIWGRLKRL
jgi:hypothetical protein